jgi:hypothetical protein
MSIRRVTADVDFTWDGGQAHLSRGQLLDVQPGSAIETAIGTGNLEVPADLGSAATNAGASN